MPPFYILVSDDMVRYVRVKTPLVFLAHSLLTSTKLVPFSEGWTNFHSVPQYPKARPVPSRPRLGRHPAIRRHSAVNRRTNDESSTNLFISCLYLVHGMCPSSSINDQSTQRQVYLHLGNCYDLPHFGNRRGH